MTVSTFIQPNFTAQLGNTYKGNIDAAIAALAQLAGNFAPHQASTPNMTVVVDAGRLWSGGLIEMAQQTTGTITAPVTNPRIDRLVIDTVTGNLSVVTGTEAASPTSPAIPHGKYLLARIALTVGQTQIVNSNIFDERPLPAPGGRWLLGRKYFTGNDSSGAATLASGISGNALRRLQVDFGLNFSAGIDGAAMGLRFNGDSANNYTSAFINRTFESIAWGSGALDTGSKIQFNNGLGWANFYGTLSVHLKRPSGGGIYLPVDGGVSKMDTVASNNTFSHVLAAWKNTTDDVNSISVVWPGTVLAGSFIDLWVDL